MEVEFGDIFPTNTCFDDVIEFCKRKLEENRLHLFTGNIKVVHGICLLKSGKLYSHAWVEIENLVYHTGIWQGKRCVLGFEKEEFYKEFQVQECTHYTILEAGALEIRHKMPGPWIEKYRKLCRDYDQQERIQQDLLPESSGNQKEG